MKTTGIRPQGCPEDSEEFARAIRDTIDFFNGKWKLPILGALIHGNYRFNELERMIPKITPRMLSKELRDLELNKVVKRTVYDTVPPTVEYSITPYGQSVGTVLKAMHKWGAEHRKKIAEKV
jgi:DNA-binding HxlR family transcriptional regulator